MQDYASSLGPLGTVESFTQAAQTLRGGMTYRSITVKLAKKTVSISIYETSDGKFEQFLVEPED